MISFALHNNHCFPQFVTEQDEAQRSDVGQRAQTFTAETEAVLRTQVLTPSPNTLPAQLNTLLLHANGIKRLQGKLRKVFPWQRFCSSATSCFLFVQRGIFLAEKGTIHG